MIMRPVFRSKEFDEIVKQYSRGGSSDPERTKIFGPIKDLLCFAAMLGFAEGRREPLSSKFGKEDIQEQIFSRDKQAMYVVYLLALAEKKTVDIFKAENVNEMVLVFEEYANGGFKILQDWLNSNPTDVDGVDSLLVGLTNLKYIGVEEKPRAATKVEF